MNIICILLICFLCLQAVHSTNDTDWDLLIFTQSWPATVCREWKEKDETHTCNMPPDESSWTIHGVWPTKLGTIGPENCNNSWEFSYEQIQPIIMKMRKLWTNVENGTDPYDLWRHEWKKHGTCAAVLEPLNSELKYFSAGLKMMSMYQMSLILNDANIYPSDDRKYEIIDIYHAIRLSTSHNPAIECRKEHGNSYLAEVRICFSKSLELIDCDGIVEFKPVLVNYERVLTNCDVHQGVLYTVDTKPEYLSYIMFKHVYSFVRLMRWFFSF